MLYSAPKKEITALAIDAQATSTRQERAKSGEQPCRSRAARPSAHPLAPGADHRYSRPSRRTPVAAPGITVDPLSQRHEPRRLGDLSHLSRRLAQDNVVLEGRPGLCAGVRRAGRLLAGTGNKGKIYAIGDNDYTDLMKASANQVTAFAARPRAACTPPPATWEKSSCSGSPVSEGTYESDVFDAKIFSKWGRAEVARPGNFELFARSGNVDNPDRNWSAWKKVDLAKQLPVELRRRASSNGKRCCIPAIPRQRSTALPSTICQRMSRRRWTTYGARWARDVPSSTHTSNTTSDSSGLRIADSHGCPTSTRSR